MDTIPVNKVKPSLVLATRLVPFEERAFSSKEVADALGYKYYQIEYFSKETVEQLQKENERLTNFIKDLADFGTRHDTNPTMVLPKTVEDSCRYWASWCSRIDESIRNRARQILNDKQNN